MKVLLTAIVTLAPLGVLNLTETSARIPSELASDGLILSREACFKMSGCTGGGHYMHSGPSGPYLIYHDDCAICITPGGCHPGCDDQLAARAPDYKRLVAEANELDVHGVLSAAKAIPEFAFYNAARASVQVLSCDGETVIASIPVEGGLRRVAAAQLRHLSGRAVSATEE